MADDLALDPLTATTTTALLATAEDAAVELIRAEAEVASYEALLKQAKEYRDYVARTVVVEAFSHASRSSLTVDNTEVKIEHRLHCHVLEPMKQDVLAWIKSLGKSDLLTVTMSTSFVRNEYAKAREFAKLAAICLGPEKPVHIVETWNIHPQTLKKFIGDTFYKTGRVAEIHPGVQYFNDNVGVVVAPPVAAPNDESENPLGA